MVKKKISGQTIAIIVLAILLLLTAVFGGVYAFYSARTNKVSGKILMANLKISLFSSSGESEKSEILISNNKNVVPGQKLVNTPLKVRNQSSVNIYLVVVYEIKATTPEGYPITDDYVEPVLGLGVDYLSPGNRRYEDTTNNKEWLDYVFTSNDGKKFRCLASTSTHAPTADNEEGIAVIPENELMLAAHMGNDYQSASISFIFQAYAIGAESFQFAEATTREEKCDEIISAIYKTQDNKFLDIV
ncbi:MAG: hypothetical protein E7351_00600 [Clostridiales bacterium]|nr:hypothetical protein [Clostridiales bacterium]